MKTHRVDSAMLEKVAYDRKSWLLMVRFRASGAVYSYRVHPRIYTALRKSESVGSFMADKIIGRYKPVAVL
jgi:hypothetical protein